MHGLLGNSLAPSLGAATKAVRLRCWPEGGCFSVGTTISEVGWGGGGAEISQSRAIAAIASGSLSLYLKDAAGESVDIEVATSPDKSFYLRSVRDTGTPTDLLALPTCQ